MNKLTTFAALVALATSTLSMHAVAQEDVQAIDCEAISAASDVTEEECSAGIIAGTDEIVYAGSAGSLGPEAIALVAALGLGFLLIDSGSGSN